MKDNESKFKDVVIMFAIIGVLATISFVSNLFGNEDTDNICGAYLGENDELESEIAGLEDEIEALKNQNDELKQDIKEWEEEYDALEESRGCSNKGSEALVDGPKK